MTKPQTKDSQMWFKQSKYLQDVDRVKSELPHVVLDYEVPYEKFNHLDFLYAMNAKSVVYDKLLQQLLEASVTNAA